MASSSLCCPSSSSSSSSSAIPNSPLRCPLCPQRPEFAHDLLLEAHLAQMHFHLRPFKCPECQRQQNGGGESEARESSFPTEWTLLEHLAQEHGQQPPRATCQLELDLNLVSKRRQIQRLMTCALLARESCKVLMQRGQQIMGEENNGNSRNEAKEGGREKPVEEEEGGREKPVEEEGGDQNGREEQREREVEEVAEKQGESNDNEWPGADAAAGAVGDGQQNGMMTGSGDQRREEVKENGGQQQQGNGETDDEVLLVEEQHEPGTIGNGKGIVGPAECRHSADINCSSHSSQQPSALLVGGSAANGSTAAGERATPSTAEIEAAELLRSAAFKLSQSLMMMRGRQQSQQRQQPADNVQQQIHVIPADQQQSANSNLQCSEEEEHQEQQQREKESGRGKLGKRRWNSGKGGEQNGQQEDGQRPIVDQGQRNSNQEQQKQRKGTSASRTRKSVNEEDEREIHRFVTLLLQREEGRSQQKRGQKEGGGGRKGRRRQRQIDGPGE